MAEYDKAEPLFQEAYRIRQPLGSVYRRFLLRWADDLAGLLGLSCVEGPSFEEMLSEATEVQPDDHRNALDGKVLQKTPRAGYDATANEPHVPQVHL
jgi:hypothetical protein